MRRNLLLLSSALLLLNLVATVADNQVSASAGAKNAVLPPPPPMVSGQKAWMKRSRKYKVVDPADQTTPVAADSLVIVGSGGPYTAKDNRVQSFSDYLDVKQDQEKGPLVMKIDNGGFRWFRVLIANELVASQKDLKGASGEIDLTGNVTNGNNQIVIQAGGSPGSTITWKVTTPASPHLDKVDPDEALLEDTVTLKGIRFSAKPSENQVLFNTKAGNIVSATEKEIKAKIPKDADIGDTKVTVKVNKRATNTVKIKVRGIPEISSTSLQGVAPGQSITVFGKNFSKDMAENKVYFGDTPAQIVNGTTTELTVIAPDVPYFNGYAPTNVKVQVGKIASKNTIPVQVSTKMFVDPGFRQGDDIPSIPVGF